MRAATYLSLSTLYDEIQARIVQEMLHGLLHAFLEFPEYERITAGSWGTGGCRGAVNAHDAYPEYWSLRSAMTSRMACWSVGQDARP